MEIELYLSEYLSKSVAEIMDNYMIYNTLELPDFLKVQYDSFKNSNLQTVLLVSIPDSWFGFKGPRSTNEAHPEKEIILFSHSKMEEHDLIASFIHNLAHIEQYQNAGKELFERYRNEKACKGIEDIYPNNKAELYAFKKQIEYLFATGIDSKIFIDYLSNIYQNEAKMKFIYRLVTKIYSL